MPDLAPATPAPAPTPERLFRIADDILGLRLPMPPPLEWVNVYFLKDQYAGQEGWAIVDTGYNTPESRAVLMEMLDQHLDGLPITRVFVTHYHPDHVGQAGYLCERYGCPLYMTQTDWLLARWLSTDKTPSYLNTITDYYHQAGTPEDVVATLSERGNSFLRTSDEVPSAFHHLKDNDTVKIGARTWRVMVGRGHAPEMYTLYDADGKLLLSADHIVARITPNISIWPYDTEINPLNDYLESMVYFAEQLPDDVTLLPGHGRPFTGFHERVAGYRTHHEGRLKKLLDGLKEGEPKTLHEISKIMFTRDLSIRDYVFALGEAHSHINYLVATGEAVRLPGRAFTYQAA